MDEEIRNKRDFLKQQILKLLSNPVDFDDENNLLEYGINSIQIMQISNILRRTGIKVTFSQLISNPTLKNWNKLIEENDEKQEIPKSEKENLYKKEPFPLTDTQYAYWIGRMDDQPLGGIGCHAYLEMDGNSVDPDRLEAAWIKILTHHPMLRARFLEDGKQEIMDTPYTDKLIIHDLRACNESEMEVKLAKIRENLSHRKLSVEKGQVIGLELSLLPKNYTRLHFDVDLLVADVQSLRIILRDLAAAYTRDKTPATKVDWNFGEYLISEQKRFAKDIEEAKQYWEKRLPEFPSQFSLPLDKSPEVIENPVFKRRKYFFKEQEWELFKKYAAFHQVTPAMVLLTVYAMILERWSGHLHFLINIPMFNRHTEDDSIEDIVADFTNLLVFEVHMDSTKTFLQQLKDIQARFHKDVANIAYSGVKVQRDLAKLHSGQRFFAPVVFACNLGEPLTNEEFDQKLGALTYMISQTPQVWLDFQIYDENKGLLLTWDVVEELFPEGLIDQMFLACSYLIKQLIINENWNIRIDVLPEEQQKRRIEDIMSIIPLPQPTKCLHTDFFQNAKNNPQKVALIDSKTDKEISYGQLSDYALRIANLLIKNGVGKNDTVAITLPRGIEQIAGVLGILAAGACYVPVCVDQPDKRREIIHNKIGIQYVISDSKRIEEICWPENTKTIDINKAGDINPLYWYVSIVPEDTAYIILTSGSTGEPKGVEVSHYSAWNTIFYINQQYKIGVDDCVLSVSALDFDLSVYDIFGLLSANGKIVLISDDDKRDASHWLKCINRYNCTIWNSVPVLLDMFLMSAESNNKVELPMRVVMLSGDWIGMDLPERLNKVAPKSCMVAMGGATEAAIWSNYFEVDLPLPSSWKSIPYGRPLKSQVYRVVDEKGRDCPDWVPGELWIGGAGVAKGYKGDEILTNEKFVNLKGLRWYRTGDMGRFWPDGTIEFLGRKDYQVKIRGHRIELGEIEAALKKHPEIKEVAVILWDNSKGNKYTVAYIVPCENKKISLNNITLKEYLKQLIPDYMIPAFFKFLDNLPLTNNGKIDRKELAKQKIEEDSFDLTKKQIKKMTKLEQDIQEIWKQIFDLNEIDIMDNFFELGGDSLIATRIITKMHEKLSVKLSIAVIFELATISEISKYVESLSENNRVFDNSQLPTIIPQRERRYEPFPLTDIQYAYWIGRKGIFPLGNVSSHCYFEIEEKNLDIERINTAFQRLINQHDMLRVVILKDGQTQKILKEVPEYKIEVVDLRYQIEEEVNRKLSKTRETMSHQMLSTDKWPLFDIRATRHGQNYVRLHISIDNIALDGWSTAFLLTEWSRLYKFPEKELSEIEVSFSDYMNQINKIYETELYKKSEEYWLNRLENFSNAPILPLSKKPEEIINQRFLRYQSKLTQSDWEYIKNRAKLSKITPSIVLLTAYAEALSKWSENKKFAVNITLFDRLPLHKEINQIMGDFTSLTLLEIDCTEKNTFIERCQIVQKRLSTDLNYSYFNGMQVQRKLAKLNKSGETVTMPIVFTSTLGVTALNKDNLMGRIIYNITQTPQIWLDHQVQEQEGELIFNWEVVEGLFPQGLIEEMFEYYCKLLKELSQNEEVWHREVYDNEILEGIL